MSRGTNNPEHVNTPFYCGPTAPLYLISIDLLPFFFGLWPLPFDPAVSTTAEASGGRHQGGPRLGQDMMGMTNGGGGLRRGVKRIKLLVRIAQRRPACTICLPSWPPALGTGGRSSCRTDLFSLFRHVFHFDVMWPEYPLSSRLCVRSDVFLYFLKVTCDVEQPFGQFFPSSASTLLRRGETTFFCLLFFSGI